MNYNLTSPLISPTISSSHLIYQPSHQPSSHLFFLFNQVEITAKVMEGYHGGQVRDL